MIRLSLRKLEANGSDASQYHDRIIDGVMQSRVKKVLDGTRPFPTLQACFGGRVSSEKSENDDQAFWEPPLDGGHGSPPLPAQVE